MGMHAFPSIMGVVNVTPDSFSDGGRYVATEAAIEHALALVGDGADLLDIGGESSRPGSEDVSVDEEIRRVIPVIEAVRKVNSDIQVSIDTRKSQVARVAIAAGATMVNDVSGLEYDVALARVVSDAKVPFILMHSRGTPQNMQDDPRYKDVVAEVKAELNLKLRFARSMGVKTVYCDVGIGFGKTAEHNWQLLRSHRKFKELGVPLVLGISRKAFLGQLLNIDEPAERDTATALLHSLLLDSGADIIRVHNVFHLTSLRLLHQMLNS